MSDFLIAFLIAVTFIIGFWTGVDWYRRKIIQEAINGKTE
jgi:hypothetical protein